MPSMIKPKLVSASRAPFIPLMLTLYLQPQQYQLWSAGVKFMKSAAL